MKKPRIIKSKQRQVATTKSKKDTKFRGLNKRMVLLETENVMFRAKLRIISEASRVECSKYMAAMARAILDKYPVCNH